MEPIPSPPIPLLSDEEHQLYERWCKRKESLRRDIWYPMGYDYHYLKIKFPSEGGVEMKREESSHA
jgi:hypothetical protein